MQCFNTIHRRNTCTDAWKVKELEVQSEISKNGEVATVPCELLGRPTLFELIQQLPLAAKKPFSRV
jgi:hypothetical protein